LLTKDNRRLRNVGGGRRSCSARIHAAGNRFVEGGGEEQKDSETLPEIREGVKGTVFRFIGEKGI